MADRKISDLTALTTPASGDYVPIVDISEAAAASKNKRITIQSLFQGIPVNVGIGTASPAAKLHVETIPQAVNQSGSVLFGPNTDYGLEIRNVIDGTGYPRVELRAPVAGAGPMLFFAGGATERLRIDSSGNVGIGTSSPQSLLHLEGGTATQNLIASSGNAVLRMADSVTSGTRKEFTITLDNTNNRVDIQAVQQGVATRNITLNAGGGNVGIGTSSPSEKLHVSGIILGDSNDNYFGSYSSGGAYLDVGNLATSAAWIDARSTSLANVPVNIRAKGTGEIAFHQTSGEKVRIDSSGRLLVGTTSKSATASTTAKGVIGLGGGGALICAEASAVANNGTVDITVSTGGLHYFTGLLQVNNINSASGTTNTQSLISVLGNTQGGTITTSVLHTATPGGGQSFTITYVATGILRFTNTSGSTCNVHINYTGGGINAS